jgi:hypothetical protein
LQDLLFFQFTASFFLFCLYAIYCGSGLSPLKEKIYFFLYFNLFFFILVGALFFSQLIFTLAPKLPTFLMTYLLFLVIFPFVILYVTAGDPRWDKLDDYTLILFYTNIAILSFFARFYFR